MPRPIVVAWVGIPCWKVSDADLRSVDIANIDVDAESELPHVLTRDGNRPRLALRDIAWRNVRSVPP